MSPLQWVAERLWDETDATAGLGYECEGCHTRYQLQYYICPRCESFCVEPRDQYHLDPDHPYYR